MDTKPPRAKYEAPKLEVQRLRELPSALASSGQHSHGSNGSNGSH
jgi:hypothetical protein